MNGYWLGFLLCLLSSGVYSQNEGLKIYYGSHNNVIYYCSDSIAVAPEIVIEGDGFDEQSEGLRISIVNYRVNEDMLVYHGPLQWHWNQSLGYLELMGPGKAAEFEDAVKQIYYKNIKDVPGTVPRNISITLKDADYLPLTGHFYRFVQMPDISWAEARDSSQMMTYYGLKGYLATITSQTENDFIWQKVRGVGWIGATDEVEEGRWVWSTGPEAGTAFWQGNYPNGYAIGGRYANWSQGEPNNSHVEINGTGEDYGHINQDPSKQAKTWNDLRIRGDGPASQYYRPQGFVVEYGGMPGDPVLHLSATTVLMINKVPVSGKRKFQICSGENLRLNELPVDDLSKYKYSWSPSIYINDSSQSSPVVSPSESESFHLVASYGTCQISASFEVDVQPSPEFLWDSIYFACQGQQVIIDPGEHHSYLWEDGTTERVLVVDDEGFVSLKLTNSHMCSKTDSAMVKFIDKPLLDLSETDTITCGSKKKRLDLHYNQDVDVLMHPLTQGAFIEGSSTLNPEITVNSYGIYAFNIKTTNTHKCVFNDTLVLGFHNLPDARFFIDSLECKGYNLKLTYLGETVEPAEFNWFSSDTLFASGTDLKVLEIPLGYGLRDRSVGLEVNEQGCQSSFTQKIKVTPLMNFSIADSMEGCSPMNVQFVSNIPEEIDSWFWSFGDGAISYEQLPEHVYLNSDSIVKQFNPSLKIVSVEGCSNSGEIENPVKVYPVPAVNFNLDDESCLDPGAEIYYSGRLDSLNIYHWDLSSIEALDIVLHPENTPGPLLFNAGGEPFARIGLQVVSGYGCASDTLFRLFKFKPDFKVEADKLEGCSPLSVEFRVLQMVENDQVEYNWDFGDGNYGKGMEVKHSFLQAGKVFNPIVTGFSLLTQCSTINSDQQVNLYPSPEASFTPDPQWVNISTPEVRFYNSSIGAEKYQWDFGDSGFSTEESPIHRFPDLGFYQVKLNVFNEFGCLDSVTHDVTVSFDKIFPPDAFSPNSIKAEDREFRIYSKGIKDQGYRLLIFNRWGQVIFESLTQQEGWDGKMRNGNFAPAGVYPWVITFQDLFGKEHRQQGTVTLLF